MDKSLILSEIKSYYKIDRDVDFAKFLGVKPQTLSSWYSRKTFDIELLNAKCVEIDANWLLSGKGPMLKSDSVQLIDGNRKTKDALVLKQEIPLYDLEATAGLKELFSSGSKTIALDTIRIPNLPKCDGAVSVTGDSMYPLLKSGDIVLYKETSVEDIFYGEMYLLSVIHEWDEYVTVKYIQKSEKGDEYVKLVSQNQHHQPKDVLISKISAIAMIKASIRINTMM